MVTTNVCLPLLREYLGGLYSSLHGINENGGFPSQHISSNIDKITLPSVLYVLASWTLHNFGNLLNRFGQLVRWGHVDLT